MRFLENEIKRYERRIQKIHENPNPIMLKSNELLYELECDARKWQLEATRENKLLADGVGLHPLLRAMGFVPLDFELAADRTAATEPERYLNEVRRMGLPDWACDRTVVMVALCTLGDYPVPSFLISNNEACHPMMMAYYALSTWYDIPSFTVDIPLEDTQESLRFVTNQLGEAIEFAEARVPGAKYDEDILRELIDDDRIAMECMRDVYKLAKSTPCPLSPKDVFRIPRLPSYYPDPQKALKYFRIYLDEVNERVQKKLGAVPEEKLRVMWAVSGPYTGDPFDILLRRGASVPIFFIGLTPKITGLYQIFGDETEYGRKLTPLEEMARYVNRNAFAGLGLKRWVKDGLDLCRDFNIDAIVHFNQVGCTSCSPLAKPFAEEAEKLGVKTLIIEGRNIDVAGYDREGFNTSLSEFIDICVSEKEMA